MQILLVAATPQEIQPTVNDLTANHNMLSDGQFRCGQAEVKVLTTGVGLTFTAFELGSYFARNRADLAINAGIAGAIDPTLEIGSVVRIVRETFADLGAEDRDGSFLDVFELGLAKGDEAPFTNGALINSSVLPTVLADLPEATAISVNRVHGSAGSIDRLQTRSDAQIESMEGAAFFYACLKAGIPFAEVRSISNYVEPRNRDNWQIPLAVQRLNAVLIDLLKSI